MPTSPRRRSLAAVAAALVLAPVAPLVTGGPSHAEPEPTPSATNLLTDLGPALGSPRAWATRALALEAGRLGVDAASVRWESVHRSLIGVHVRGRSYRDGVPVAGSDVLVSAIDGRIAQVAAAPVDLPGHAVSRAVPTRVARAAAVAAIGSTDLLVTPHLTRALVPVGDRLRDTWTVSLVSQVPARAATVQVDAATGAVRSIVDDSDAARAKRDGGETVQAQVFDPNPVVTARDTSLRSPFETGTGVDVPLDSAELTAQLKTRPMRHLDASALQQGRLLGPWADIVAPVGYLTALGEPLGYSRTDPRFVGLMSYLHVDRYQSWLQSLGIKDANAEPQRIVPTLAQGYDNSFYQPGNDIIVFGGGGVPDAEDAEVILHEYGHAMQDAQVPGYGATDAGGSMGEGFGDFNAANYFAMTSDGFNDLCAAEWDATAYSTDDPPCLRRLDSTKRFPADIEGEVHADGEMWSAFLWRVRDHLGRTAKQKSVNAIKLVTSMHELLTPQAEYGDAVAGLIRAARALGHPAWARAVVREAKVTGYPTTP
ncbi:M36 family metallopeptidase [Nocardioides fonticola]|uniref:M36 family metallopeptidase n=1 Tax=Nocardioides fonticola TaxID=450363 RepID=A0ABP7XBW5_9ACTN